MIRSDTAYRKAENSRLLREDVARGASVFRALPEVVTLNHTDICNLRCIMCARHTAQGKHRLTQDVLGYVAEELFPTARKLVLTTAGGEPLGADFEFLLQRALTHAVAIDAVTNGVLLTRDLYRNARPAFDHLNVSLDSHVPEVYEKIRVGARFEQVLGNLRRIRDLRRDEPDDVLYSTSAVVMASNLPHLAGFVRFAADLGFSSVVLQRLLHTVKPTRSEEPMEQCGEAAMRASFDAAEVAARESGVNLYRTEFGLPPVIVREVRDKRPDLLLSHRLCWFMAQNFGVMYTGEVYPCCVPTDYMLGNVLYEDPVSIWNGKKAQALRAAQQSGRGTTFCNGCLHAPHLPSPRFPKVTEKVRIARRAVQHVVGKAERKVRARISPLVLKPPVPQTTRVDGAFLGTGREGVRRAATQTAAPQLRNDVAVVQPNDGSLWLVRDGELWHAPADGAAPTRRLRLREAPAPRATALCYAEPCVLLVAFEGEGQLLRIPLDRTPLRADVALTLSDSRAFIRNPAVAVATGGDVYVGEYGVYPGARCGRVYRAVDGRAPFRERLRVDWARHIHVLHATRAGGVLVTTGDLAGHRRLLAIPAHSGFVRTVERAWSGFTAATETRSAFHFGTDLIAGNGLVRRDLGLLQVAELRPMPDELDLQVRNLTNLGGGRMAALLSMDADLPERRLGRRAALLSSFDEGLSWNVSHLFADDWSDVPESLLLVPGSAPRVLTLCSDEPIFFDIVDRSSER